MRATIEDYWRALELFADVRQVEGISARLLLLEALELDAPIVFRRAAKRHLTSVATLSTALSLEEIPPSHENLEKLQLVIGAAYLGAMRDAKAMRESGGL